MDAVLSKRLWFAIMSNGRKLTAINKAWNALFKKYNLLRNIDADGFVSISAKRIKDVREPRLMVKFDSKRLLPDVFVKNHLSILPVSRNEYMIFRVDPYHNLEKVEGQVEKVEMPSCLQTLSAAAINSESIAINCAIATGILNDFLDEEKLTATISGRIGSSSFDFRIRDINKNDFKIHVQKAQLEIDSTVEGVDSIAVIEAKREILTDFMVRQLYYPYRLLKNKECVTKTVRPVFLIYSNGFFYLYEYKFDDLNRYDSIRLVRSKRYSIEDTRVQLDDIYSLLEEIERCVKEPYLPFPQADSFERVVNLCELLSGSELTLEGITNEYTFDMRQARYYVAAARYLGLVNQVGRGCDAAFVLSDRCKEILERSYRDRQLDFCRCILEHKVFKQAFALACDKGALLEVKEVVRIMKRCKLRNMESEATYSRRAHTVIAWVRWIFKLAATEE